MGRRHSSIQFGYVSRESAKNTNHNKDVLNHNTWRKIFDQNACFFAIDIGSFRNKKLFCNIGLRVAKL